MADPGGYIVLVVQGRRISVSRTALATVSKFFRALFSHKFEDSSAPVLHLDTGGEMGLTVAAVRVNSIINSLYHRDMVVMAPSLNDILN